MGHPSYYIQVSLLDCVPQDPITIQSTKPNRLHSANHHITHKYCVSVMLFGIAYRLVVDKDRLEPGRPKPKCPIIHALICACRCEQVPYKLVIIRARIAHGESEPSYHPLHEGEVVRHTCCN